MPGDYIVQIGFTHWYDTADQLNWYCKFYEIVNATSQDNDPQPYDFSNMPSNDTFVYFQILQTPISGTDYWVVQDCGSDSTYTSGCQIESDYQAVHKLFFNDFMGALAESDMGGCAVVIAGDSSDRDNIGTSSNPLQVKPNGDSYFGSEPLDGFSGDGAPCSSHYNYALPVISGSTNNSENVTTWDGRNTD